jgi:hypothetical protein
MSPQRGVPGRLIQYSLYGYPWAMKGRARGDAAAKADELARRNSKKREYDRLALLNDELNILLADARERSASVANKSTFLAVSAGVLIAAISSTAWKELALLASIGLASSCLALLCAAIASLPSKTLGIVAQRLTDRHMSGDHSLLHIARGIVSDKSSGITLNEARLAARAKWTSAGFFLLIGGAVALSVVYTAEVLR